MKASKIFLYKKTVISIFLTVVIVLVAAIISFKDEIKHQNLNNTSDKLSLALKAQLGREQESALRFAIILSQNEAISKALIDGDEDVGFEILAKIMKEVKKYTNNLVRSQIITPDYFILARSWDNMYAGFPLDDSRSDLDYFKTHKTPRVSIEVGRRLGIKATVPIFKEDRLLGYVEVLEFFDASTTFFRELGIDLYILMDYDFYNTAVLMQNNPTVGSYIIANRAYNSIHINTLERLDFKKLQREKVLESDDKYIFYNSMTNAAGEKIGIFVMVMPKTEIDDFSNKNDEISIFINFSHKDLYDIVKKETLKNELYRSEYDKALLYLKDTIADENKELFVKEANDILQTYTKEELIALILKHRNAQRIEGEIR